MPAEAIDEPDWRSGKAQAARISRADGHLMGIAGLWSQCGEQYSFTMLTVNADDHPLMRQFHRAEDEKRRVVILPIGAYRDWLNPAHEGQALLGQYPTQRLLVQA